MIDYYTGDHGAEPPDEGELGTRSSGEITRVFDRSSIMGDINVTPMVDVMLVLLIIFMVVTPALVAGFNAQLPQGLNLKARPEEEQRTTLGIDGTGAYYLNTRPVAGCGAEQRADATGRARCAAEIQRLLMTEIQSHPQDRVLFVKADRSLKYQEVIDVMRLAKGAGARVVAAVTEQRAEPEADGEESAP